MNEKLLKTVDGLAPLLFEANVVLGIQHRSADVGILVNRVFVQARLERWRDAIAGIRLNLRTIAPQHGHATGSARNPAV